MRGISTLIRIAAVLDPARTFAFVAFVAISIVAVVSIVAVAVASIVAVVIPILVAIVAVIVILACASRGGHDPGSGKPYPAGYQEKLEPFRLGR